MAFHDVQYLNLVKELLVAGAPKGDRTGTGTLSSFGHRMEFDLSDNSVPVLTTKLMRWNSMMHEVVWYFSGSTNIKYLVDNGVNIWSNWADALGDLGPLYGHQLRNFNGFDQLKYIIDEMSTHPDSRRAVVSYWDPNLLPTDLSNPSANPAMGRQALAPCHAFWQVYSKEIEADELGRTRQLSLQLYQRSADVFLGVPFNIAQYSIILHLLCAHLNMAPGKFVWVGGDTHIYSNHRDQLYKQLARAPFESPSINISSSFDIMNLQFDNVTLSEYQTHGPLAGKVAV